jgi:hypothetical protein
MAFLFKQILGIWLILSLLLWPSPTQAEEPIQLILHNIPLQDDRLLVVTVQLENVTDLYGVEIQLSYDPTQLKVRDEDPRLEGVQIAPGPLLAFDDRFVALNQADAQAGLIDFVFTLLKPAPPINKAGVLATVAFEVKGGGPFKVEVTEAKFVSAQLTAIPVTTTDLTRVGPPHLSPALPQPVSPISSFGWGWVMGGILGGIILALLLLRLFPRGATAMGSQAAPRRVPSHAASPTQTAALLTGQGYRAAQQGRLAQAYDHFSQAIELDPASARAWLGKGQVAQPDAEKRICFQRALALDPTNTQVQAELQQLDTSVVDKL